MGWPDPLPIHALDAGLATIRLPNSLNRATAGPAGNQIDGAAVSSPTNCAPHRFAMLGLDTEYAERLPY